MHPQTHKRILLINLTVASLVGILIRYMYVSGDFIPFLRNLQHAHSHFAFSGWISQSLFLFIYLVNTKSTLLSRRHSWLLYLHAACAYGMLFSFSIQGYKLISIILSTLSIFISFALIVNERLERQKQANLNSLLLNTAYFFNILSTIGTFFLAWLTATNKSSDLLHEGCINLYLHFQFNGWFIFACLYIAQNTSGISAVLGKNKRVIYALIIATIVSFSQTMLPLTPYPAVFTLAFMSTFAQLLFFCYLLKSVFSAARKKKRSFLEHLLLLVGFFLIAKLIIQCLSAIPSIAPFYFHNRSVTIAYLHLVFLLIVTNFIIYRLILDYQQTFLLKSGILLFNTGILLTEFVLLGMGFGGYLSASTGNIFLLIGSLVGFTGILILATAKKTVLR